MHPPTDSQWLNYATEPVQVPPAELGLMKCVYLSDRRAHRDPTIVWGTQVPAQPLVDFAAAESRRLNVFVSPAHVLVAAVSRAIAEHPRMNRKVIGRRVHDYRHINLIVPQLNSLDNQVEGVFIPETEHKTLAEIARFLLTTARERALQTTASRRRDAELPAWRLRLKRVMSSAWLHWVRTMMPMGLAVVNQFRRPSFAWSQDFNAISAMVNLISFPGGAPPMLTYKPSSLPMNAALINVTMGGPEWRPVVVDGQVVARRVAPLFVRADHRICHAHELAAFLGTLCRCLSEPQCLLDSPAADASRAA